MAISWKGGWSGSDSPVTSLITYYSGDVVLYESITYTVQTNVLSVAIGSPPPPSDMSHWDVMIAGGANGTSGSSGTSGSGTSGSSGTSGANGSSGTMDHQALQVLMDHQVLQVLMDHQEQVGLRDHQDLVVQVDHLDHQAQRVKLEHQVLHLAHLIREI